MLNKMVIISSQPQPDNGLTWSHRDASAILWTRCPVGLTDLPD